jgi:hypothetical protein
MGWAGRQEKLRPQVRCFLLTPFIELLLLLAFIIGCGYFYQNGPSVLKLPMALLIGLGTWIAILLLFRVLGVAFKSSK